MEAETQVAPQPDPEPQPKRKSTTPSRNQTDVIIILLAAIFLLSGWTAFSQRTTWEYKIVAPSDLTIDTRINALGKDGWELVSARRATSSLGGESTAAYEMIFRRRKPLWGGGE
jgi:hypothetical protein